MIRCEDPPGDLQQTRACYAVQVAAAVVRLCACRRPDLRGPFLENGLDSRGSVDICTLTVMRQVCRSQLVQCDYGQVTRKGTRKIATRGARELNDLSPWTTHPGVQRARRAARSRPLVRT